MNSVTHPSVEVYIEELVLHGFAPGERHQIAAAMQQELSRLMRERGVREPVGKPAALARLNAGVIRIRAGATARTAGAEIGRAVYRSLQQGVGIKRAGRPAQGVRPR